LLFFFMASSFLAPLSASLLGSLLLPTWELAFSSHLREGFFSAAGAKYPVGTAVAGGGV
jgi:hypothetical protein